MKAETKAAKLAALFGMEAPVQLTTEQVDRKDGISREAEATIAYFESPAKFTERLCRMCHRPFAVNRSSISCCSDHCRIERLAELGIDWNPNRTIEDRWNLRTGGPEPLIVPPRVLELFAQSQALLAVQDTEVEAAG